MRRNSSFAKLNGYMAVDYYNTCKERYYCRCLRRQISLPYPTITNKILETTPLICERQQSLHSKYCRNIKRTRHTRTHPATCATRYHCIPLDRAFHRAIHKHPQRSTARWAPPYKPNPMSDDSESNLGSRDIPSSPLPYDPVISLQSFPTHP